MGFKAGGATQRQYHRGAGHPPARPITSPEPASCSMHAVRECSAQHVQPVQTCMMIVVELVIGREVRHGSRDGRPAPQHHLRFKPIFTGTHMCSESSREPRGPSSQKSTVRESRAHGWRACATAARWESRERRREDRGRAGPRGRGKEEIRETGIWDREGIAPRKSDPDPEIT